MDSQQEKDKSAPDLTQDDFEWGEDLEQPASPDAAIKTTELDRIEFDDLEEPEIKPEPQTSEPEEDSKDSDSSFSRLLNLLFNSKIIMLSGIVVILLTVGISLIVLIPWGGEEEATVETTQMELTPLDMPPAYEHTLADFIVPASDSSTSAFVSYKVRLTVKSALYDYYLAKEQRVRADIYEALKEADKKNDFQQFSENVRKKANAFFKKAVIESAAVISGDKR